MDQNHFDERISVAFLRFSDTISPLRWRYDTIVNHQNLFSPVHPPASSCSYKALQRMQEDRLEYEEYVASLPTDGSVPGNPNNVPSQKVLGIDFGTSSLRCAILNDHKATIVEDRDGSRDTPSYVYFEDPSASPLVPVVGQLAKSKVR